MLEELLRRVELAPAHERLRVRDVVLAARGVRVARERLARDLVEHDGDRGGRVRHDPPVGPRDEDPLAEGERA